MSASTINSNFFLWFFLGLRESPHIYTLVHIQLARTSGNLQSSLSVYTVLSSIQSCQLFTLGSLCSDFFLLNSGRPPYWPVFPPLSLKYRMPLKAINWGNDRAALLFSYLSIIIIFTYIASNISKTIILYISSVFWWSCRSINLVLISPCFLRVEASFIFNMIS